MGVCCSPVTTATERMYFEFDASQTCSSSWARTRCSGHPSSSPTPTYTERCAYFMPAANDSITHTPFPGARCNHTGHDQIKFAYYKGCLTIFPLPSCPCPLGLSYPCRSNATLASALVVNKSGPQTTGRLNRWQLRLNASNRKNYYNLLADTRRCLASFIIPPTLILSLEIV